MKKFFIVLFIFLLGMPIVKAQNTISLDSSSAILMDYNSGKILFEKNSHDKLPMASMTKIMSMLLIMEKINDGSLKYSDKIIISKNASGMGGSQVFLQEGEEYKVEDLLKCIAVSSANDAVVAMAEAIGGSVDNFVTMMNDKAKELGMNDSHFANPHGLDNENHYSTAYDMAILAKELLKYQDILKYTSIYEDYLTKPDGSQVWLVNTNRLVRFYDGVDGLKTGYTTDALYCLTATAKKNDLRLISVVMHASSSDARSKDTATLLTYGFNSFKNYVVYSKDDILGTVKVEKGKMEEVNVYLKENMTELVGINDNVNNYSFHIKIDKVVAPKEKDEIVGKAEVINAEGDIIKEVDVVIHDKLEKANYGDYLKKYLKLLTSGK